MIARALRALVCCLALASCVGFNAVEAGKPVNVGDGITVDSQVAWAHGFGGNASGTVWTIDGFGLNELRFLTAIAPGSPLLQIAGVARSELGTYQTSMLPNDVMDLLSTTLARIGQQQVRTSALRPVPFGSDSGFRFELEFVTRDGLQMKGMVLGAQRRGKLDLIAFTAPVEFYFDRYAPMVEQIFASVRVPAAAQARAS
jgi:hypothetical protein